jgi:hypothetical protein
MEEARVLWHNALGQCHHALVQCPYQSQRHELNLLN